MPNTYQLLKKDYESLVNLAKNVISPAQAVKIRQYLSELGEDHDFTIYSIRGSNLKYKKEQEEQVIAWLKSIQK